MRTTTARPLAPLTILLSAVVAAPLLADVHPAAQEAFETQRPAAAPVGLVEPDPAGLGDPIVHLRSTESADEVLSLEIALTELRPVSAERSGPTITLVGVAHIGDAAYYERLQTILDRADIVLYESVMPPGAAGPIEIATDEDRADRTLAAMGFVGATIVSGRSDDGTLPASLAASRARAVERDGRLGSWLERAAIDAWGHPMIYERSGDGRSFTLTSLGADGAEGGSGVDADLVAPDHPRTAAAIEAMAGGDEGGSIQAELAAALGLAFQLEAIRYDRPSYRCVDMDLDQLGRALEARGLAIDDLGAALGDQSLTGRRATVMLRMIRVMDRLLGGAVADTMKVVMVEMLGDAQLVDRSLDQVAPGLGAVLIDERNQVVIDALIDVVEDADPDETIAIFYGAGHMADFIERLEDQLGYVPVAQQWLEAMGVDLSESAIDKRQLNMIRLSIRSAMRQMGG